MRYNQRDAKAMQAAQEVGGSLHLSPVQNVEVVEWAATTAADAQLCTPMFTSLFAVCSSYSSTKPAFCLQACLQGLHSSSSGAASSACSKRL
jgi:hypothetical protein